MVQFSMFGGYEGVLDADGRTYITIFAGTELTRPPFASRVAALVRRGQHDLRPPRGFMLTIFGGAEIKWPTLAEEFLALRDALRTGTLTMEDWDRAITQTSDEGLFHPASFTLFGALSVDEAPEEDKELDGMALQRHQGEIPDDAVQELLLAIGQTGVQRLAAVRQAVAKTMQAQR
jgi:hypothetical protein